MKFRMSCGIPLTFVMNYISDRKNDLWKILRDACCMKNKQPSEG